MPSDRKLLVNDAGKLLVNEAGQLADPNCCCKCPPADAPHNYVLIGTAAGTIPGDSPCPSGGPFSVSFTKSGTFLAANWIEFSIAPRICAYQIFSDSSVPVDCGACNPGLVDPAWFVWIAKKQGIWYATLQFHMLSSDCGGIVSGSGLNIPQDVTDSSGTHAAVPGVPIAGPVGNYTFGGMASNAGSTGNFFTTDVTWTIELT